MFQLGRVAYAKAQRPQKPGAAFYVSEARGARLKGQSVRRTAARMEPFEMRQGRICLQERQVCAVQRRKV